MKPCWKSHGLTKKGAALADSVLPEVQALMDRVNAEVLKVVLQEATFRKYDLPLRSAAYQRQYLKDNE